MCAEPKIEFVEFRSAFKQLSARLRDLCLHSFLIMPLPSHFSLLHAEVRCTRSKVIIQLRGRRRHSGQICIIIAMSPVLHSLHSSSSKSSFSEWVWGVGSSIARHPKQCNLGFVVPSLRSVLNSSSIQCVVLGSNAVPCEDVSTALFLAASLRLCCQSMRRERTAS